MESQRRLVGSGMLVMFVMFGRLEVVGTNMAVFGSPFQAGDWVGCSYFKEI